MIKHFNSFKTILTNFLTITGAIYLFVEINESYKSKYEYWLFLFLCGVISALILFILNKKSKIENDPNYEVSNELRIENIILSNYIKKAKTQNNSYKLHFLKWRLQHENKKFERVITGSFALPILPLYCYMRTIFTGMTEMLLEGDEYYSISTFSFWKEDDVYENNPGIEKVENFMAENIDSIKNKRTKIFRIIIIDNSLRAANKDKNKDRKRLEDLVRDFNERISELTPEEKLRFKVMFFYSDNYKNQIGKYQAPYAYIKRNEKYLVKAVPINLENGSQKMPSIVFEFCDNKTNIANFKILERNYNELYKMGVDENRLFTTEELKNDLNI